MSEYSFTDLKSDFDKNMALLVDEFAAFPWEDRECYAQWLAHSYQYVSHSTRLLAMAAARCELHQQSIHKRFVEHLAEETGHEKLAISDLKQLGCQIENFTERTETALFYQNQYYWINYFGATPFLGWILALEGGAVHACGKAYKRVVNAHGAKAGIFLKIHSEEDIDHLEKALAQVKSLPSDALQMIAKNLGQSSELYCAVFRKISASSKRTNRPNAA